MPRHGTLSKRAVQTQIEVRDAQDKPIPGAQVIFQLPASGAGGSFPGGRLTQRTATDPRGQASTSGFVPNDAQGRFNMKVNITSGGQVASAIVAQVNVEKDGRGLGEEAPPLALDTRRRGRWRPP